MRGQVPQNLPQQSMGMMPGSKPMDMLQMQQMQQMQQMFQNMQQKWSGNCLYFYLLFIIDITYNQIIK